MGISCNYLDLMGVSYNIIQPNIPNLTNLRLLSVFQNVVYLVPVYPQMVILIEKVVLSTKPFAKRKWRYVSSINANDPEWILYLPKWRSARSKWKKTYLIFEQHWCQVKKWWDFAEKVSGLLTLWWIDPALNFVVSQATPGQSPKKYGLMVI